MLFKRSGRLTGVSQGLKKKGSEPGWERSARRAQRDGGRGRGKNPGKKESERWGLDWQRERLTDLKEGGLNENIYRVKSRRIDKWVGRSEGKMEALAEIQYEIGCRIRVHLETWLQRGQKMKGLCKEDQGEGRWETGFFLFFDWLSVVTSVYLRLKNISSAK